MHNEEQEKWTFCLRLYMYFISSENEAFVLHDGYGTSDEAAPVNRFVGYYFADERLLVEYP